MNDNDIIKALKHCVKSGNCSECLAFKEKWSENCQLGLITCAFDLINRLKAEIERLTGYNENLQAANTALSNEILDIKTEAIKEFAEKLKERARMPLGTLYGRMVYIADIESLVKEMTEVEDESVAC